MLEKLKEKLSSWLHRPRFKREIIVNVEKLETRVAVIENGRLEEYMVEHPEEERLVGSIFKGRIQNLEHDLQAAFVDIGLPKNAFLHYWDMSPDVDAFLDDDEEAQKGSNRPNGKGGKGVAFEADLYTINVNKSGNQGLNDGDIISAIKKAFSGK